MPANAFVNLLAWNETGGFSRNPVLDSTLTTMFTMDDWILCPDFIFDTLTGYEYWECCRRRDSSYSMSFQRFNQKRLLV
jgi:hypothetical protein